MALSINTNATSSYLQQNLSRTSQDLSESVKRLGLGTRITRTDTTDDTAGLDINSKFDELNKRIGPAYAVELSQGNLDASRASIRSADVPSESSALMRQQAGTAILSQANQTPQQLVSLLLRG